MDVTANQQEVLDVMAWRGCSWPMTISEIVSRIAKARKRGWSPSRPTVAGRLDALERKGLVKVVEAGQPRKYARTDLPRGGAEQLELV